MGKPGRSVLAGLLPVLAERWNGFDFVVVNAENAAAGKGLTSKIAQELFSLGVDGMTSGNHIWDKNEVYPLLDADGRIVRPLNFPAECPGIGTAVLEKNGKRLGLLNLQGRVFMPPIDCPFRIAAEALETFEDVPVLVDFHAEASSEKVAMGYWLDGKAAAVVGTHTHVQTADETVLPGGTAYITDVGMTGGHGGVIGMAKETVMPRYLTGMPSKFEVSEVRPVLNAVVIEIDDETQRAINISRVFEPAPTGPASSQ